MRSYTSVAHARALLSRHTVTWWTTTHLVDDDVDAPAELAATVLERRIATCDVSVPGILDLRPAIALERVYLDDTTLRSEVGDYDACQALGAATHQLGLNGIIAPAATGLGETLALFPLNLPAEQWPTITATDIWHRLPADPRRLRLTLMEVRLSRAQHRMPAAVAGIVSVEEAAGSAGGVARRAVRLLFAVQLPQDRVSS